MSWTIANSKHKGGSLLVLLMIANHAGSDGAGAWPSTATIATECRMSERQVRRIIDTILEPSGELEVERRLGKPHVYDLPGVRTPEKITGVDPGQDVRPTLDKMSDPPRTFSAPTPDITDGNPGHSYVRRTKDNQRQPSRSKDSLVHGRDITAFDEFWEQYPRKAGKGAARAAWTKRIKAGADPDVLVGAARVFAAWVVEALSVGELESMKYVAHPTTWLNQERDGDQLTRPGRAPAAMSHIERQRAERARRGQEGRGTDRGGRRVGVELADASGNLRALGLSDRGPG